MLKPTLRLRLELACLLPGLIGCALVVVACGSSADTAGAAGFGSGAAGEGGAQGGTTSQGASGALGGGSGAGSAGTASANGGAGTSLGGLGGSGSGGFSAGSAGKGAAGESSGGSAGKAGAAGASSGGSTGGSAGSSGAGGSGTNSDYLETRTNDYGFVEIAASSKNQIVSLTTTLAVPIKPTENSGTLFLWPGLQPGGANYDPIDNGVLQPVLTWGPTCAPNAPKNGYASWWISAQYVNTFGSDAGYTGCLGGNGMNVQVGDELAMVMTLNGTVWHQAITDSVSQESVSYDIDMLGQAQNYAEFVIEMYTENPAADVVFTATTVTFADSEAAACQPTVRGIDDFFTNPKASPDGKQCTIDRIVLRAQGVPATTPN
ncbi:MAG TPA: hypothetical protein VK745_21515 [Polyangiaceae bacterium]|nr:hypothetical protein [Polyangiaceae bacterium]